MTNSLTGCRYCLDDNSKRSGLVDGSRNRFVLLWVHREVFGDFDAMDVDDDNLCHRTSGRVRPNSTCFMVSKTQIVVAGRL